MNGPSRHALAAGHEQLEALVSPGPRGGAAKADAATVGDELFAVSGVLGTSPGLRRALTDPTRPAEAKQQLVHRLFDGQIGAATIGLLGELVGTRWTEPTDLADGIEELGVSAVLASAQQNGRLDDVEDELFRFSRTVAHDIGLKDAFSTRTIGAERKSALVNALLGGKVAPETVRLALQAATAPRGVRTETALESYLAAAALRRSQLVADVVSAVPLSAAQQTRLADLLQRSYGHQIRVNLTVEPEVLGGLRVQVAGELLDSTMLARLERARRALTR